MTTPRYIGQAGRKPISHMTEAQTKAVMDRINALIAGRFGRPHIKAIYTAGRG
jgi:hypothetical protein